MCIGADSSEEEYLHLPPALPATLTPAPAPAPPSGTHRSIEIVEGRVVSRGAVTLIPPRRADPAPHVAPHAAPHVAPHAAPLAAADIMDMPIVFADDDPAPPPPPPPAPDTNGVSGGGDGDVTVTSGVPLKYTRVIVASRGGGAGAGAGGAGAGGEERGSRPLLLRRGLRLVHRHK
ncbi:hypothetical protein evm_008589 [Chilo suppressalis]|nr:hypothetical protein evm_008589 [Chilo suppressalis]